MKIQNFQHKSEKFEKAKSWFARKLSSESHTEQVINVLEERSIWQRYGF